MKTIPKFSSLLLGGLLLTPLLTGCLPTPMPYDPPVSLSFSLPTSDTQNLKVAAIYFEAQADGTNVAKVVPNSNGSIYGSTASVQLYGLKALAANTKCTSPFVGGETKGMTQVTVTPDTVNTCNIYFSVFRDANNDGVPNNAEEKYMTHDMYSYASADFTYSMQTANGQSTESGTRRAGWSLVRHTVYQSSTTGKYLVGMNSVPTADENIVIRLHEPTDFMTSMSLPVTGQGGQP